VGGDIAAYGFAPCLPRSPRWRAVKKEQIMKEQKLTKADLAQFTGTEQWHRHSMVRNVYYTDGIQYIAETGEAYWLINEVAFLQQKPQIAKEEFQRWILQVDLDQSTAILSCDDGNGRILHSKKISYTDFPLDEIKLYVSQNVILLPSEY
jgi:hypothetical protein